MKIEDIENPIERFVAFIAEREAIRIRRFVMKKPWPWTDNDILQDYRFTNVHREDDAVSQHYQNTVRNRYLDRPLVLPTTVAYRWFNRISTCNALFNESHLNNLSVFEQYIDTGDEEILLDCLKKLPPPHVTGAFIVTGKPGFPKGEGVIHYIHSWCRKPWREFWETWQKDPPLLSKMYSYLYSEGLGSFMLGQLVADLKYLPFIQGVADWWDWATPGPGSLRGMNFVHGRPMMSPYSKGQWLNELIELSNTVTPLLAGYGMDRLHNQDLQNCLCEFSKFTKAATGQGRPRQTFKNRVI
jgi:hypothetical protein